MSEAEPGVTEGHLVEREAGSGDLDEETEGAMMKMAIGAIVVAVVSAAFGWFAPAVIAGVVAMPLLSLGLAARMDRSVLGRVESSLVNNELVLSFTPRAEALIMQVTMDVRCIRRDRRGTRDDRRYHETVLEEFQFVVSDAIPAQPGERVELRRRVEIPDWTMTAADRGSDFRIRWEGDIRIVIEGLPDWTRTWDLRVRDRQ